MGRAVAVVASLALTALSACNLYFAPGSDDGSTDDQPPPDGWVEPPPPDAPPSCATIAYCGGDGVLYRTSCLSGALPDDLYTRGTAYGMCNNGCRTDSNYWSCGGDASCGTAEADLCAAPLACPETGQTCNAEGAVSRCTQRVGCAVTAAVRDCTCTNGAFQCRPSCTADTGGLCGPAGVGQAMDGTWRGGVTPGNNFEPPYTASVIFKPDRTYVAQSPGTQAAFTWGSDGTSPVYRWRPIGVAPSGGIATVDLYFGIASIRTGLATDVQRQGDRLRFTFWDAWLDCSRPLAFDLTRQP